MITGIANFGISWVHIYKLYFNNIRVAFTICNKTLKKVLPFEVNQHVVKDLSKDEQRTES